MARLLEPGYTYQYGDNVEYDEPKPFPEPPEYIQGEPWGWTKPGARPHGWREDGKYDSD